jgi:hypothetical protein
MHVPASSFCSQVEGGGTESPRAGDKHASRSRSASGARDSSYFAAAAASAAAGDDDGCGVGVSGFDDDSSFANAAVASTLTILSQPSCASVDSGESGDASLLFAAAYADISALSLQTLHEESATNVPGDSCS